MFCLHDGILITQKQMSESMRFILLRWWARQSCPLNILNFAIVSLHSNECRFLTHINIYPLFVTISWFNISEYIRSIFYFILWMVVWLFDLFIEWLIGCLIYLLNGWLVVWFIYWMIDWLFDLFIEWLIGCLIYWLNDWLVYLVD